MARNYAALPYDYLEEMEALNDAEFGRLTRALLKYSMAGEPIALCGNERFYAKRVMAQEDRFKNSYEETKERKKEAGRKGAEKRWDSKNGKAISAIASDGKNGNTETDTETNTDISPSNDGMNGVAATNPPLGVVISAYMDKINPTPSAVSVAELKSFVEDLGQECCLRAIDIALDEKKTSWSYIKAILKTKREQGVRCLADWDRIDAQREAQKAAKSSKNAGWEPGKSRDPAPTAAAEEKSRRQMEETRRLLAMMKEDDDELHRD